MGVTWEWGMEVLPMLRSESLHADLQVSFCYKSLCIKKKTISRLPTTLL